MKTLIYSLSQKKNIVLCVYTYIYNLSNEIKKKKKLIYYYWADSMLWDNEKYWES